MTRRAMGSAVASLILMLGLTACRDDVVYVDPIDDFPAAPRALEAAYYAGVVTVSWELAPAWDGEAFRVYGRRTSDASFFLIAEVTSCIDNVCSYQDLNVVGGETYEYYVTAVSPNTGNETETESTVTVLVPTFTPPPVPDAVAVIALDNANYLTWGTAARDAADFSHYKVYQELEGQSYLLGETDSEGFLDLLAANGETYAYFLTSVDSDGHESNGSALGEGTPRPDFHGEWLYDYFDQPTVSGFRFAEDEVTNPIVSGDAAVRHFRLESDAQGWWIVPGPGTAIYPTGFATTALKCGVAADATCEDVSVAPTNGYVMQDVQIFTQESYVLEVIGDDGLVHYGVIRPELLGVDQNGDGIMIFAWAYQLQAGNPNLVSPTGG